MTSRKALEKLAKKEKKNKKKHKDLPPFDKYEYYKASVQAPDVDAEFNFNTFKELKGRKPVSFTEDFCGTFAISCEMAKLDPDIVVQSVDLDQEPLEYGKKTYYAELTPQQQNRISIMNRNVLDSKIGKTDIICAQNFSYFCFKTRAELKNYFAAALQRLTKDGIFLVDCFGGEDCFSANEQETEHDTFSYFWDQDTFNPVTHEGMFYIHFKRKGEKKREKVFTYDWRLWSIPEIRDIMTEVGFSKTHIYWEGTDENGEGNGEFSPTEEGEECESWIAYIIGEK